MDYKTAILTTHRILITLCAFAISNFGAVSAVHCQDNTPSGIEKVAPLSTAVPEKNRLEDKALCHAWNAAILNPKKVGSLSRARFVGFVEGRLKVTVPEWWEDMLLRVNIELNYLRFDPGDLSIYTMNNQKFKTSSGVSVSTKGDQIEVMVKDVRINLASRGTSGMRIGTVAALATEDSVYLVLASDTPRNSDLVKADLDGSIVWKANISGDLQPLSHSGRQLHFIEPVLGEDGRIHVFGGGGNCYYIESFDAQTGANIVRFFTPTMLDRHVD